MERLIKIGNVKPKSALEVKISRFGVGFEKLDRGLFDPNKAYDKAAQLGVKWVRLQSGWARTEKEKGVYDFAWLDDIVDNLIKRGLKPWLCLCYGNALYTPEAAKVFGAVSCAPIETEEERNAWSNYVSAVASHFKGRVEHYEIWNEPHWFWTHIAHEHQPNGTEYGNFVIATTKAIKKCDTNAKIIAGVEYIKKLSYTNKTFETGMADYIDYFSFHTYTADERKIVENKRIIRGFLDKYNPNVKIIQGETGAPSRSNGKGELSWGAWTPKKQAKILARRAITDFMLDFEISSYFSCLDMAEALNGRTGDKSSILDYGYFGVLSAEFDENGVATGEYKPKMSYKTLQTICSLFSDGAENANLPISITPLESRRVFGMDVSENIMSGGFKKPNGSSAFAYWHSSDLMTTDFESTISMQVVPFGEIKLVDLLDGTIYKLPESMIEDNDGYLTLKNIPIRDYPLLLTFGDF